MEAEDPLKELRDIHLPDAVAFWPPAPGWWVLLAVILIILALTGRRSFLAMIRRRKLASVLAELDTAFADFEKLAVLESTRNQAGLDFLSTLNRILKRVAQVMYPNANSGLLTGRQWLQFLDSCDNSTDFDTGAGKALGDGIYRRTFDANAEAVYRLARQWVENRYLADVEHAPARGQTA